MGERDRRSPLRGTRTADDFRELRVLLVSAQLLTIFLVATLFTDRFRRLPPHMRGVYITALVATVNSLLLFAAPLVWRERTPLRRGWPRLLRDPSRMVTAGRLTLALAVILTTDVVMNAVSGEAFGITWALIVAFILGAVATDTPPDDADDPWKDGSA